MPASLQARGTVLPWLSSTSMWRNFATICSGVNVFFGILPVPFCTQSLNPTGTKKPGHVILDLEHYLDVLYRKPGALSGSKPLEQKRRAGLWPASFDQIWEALIEKQGKQSGTRQMIGLLKLGQEHGRDRLQPAIEKALATSC